MTNQFLPIVAFFIICIGLSIAAHKRNKDIFSASLISAAGTNIIFQMIGYFVLGYIDPFIFIALVVGSIIAFIVSLVIGIIMKRLTKNETTKAI